MSRISLTNIGDCVLNFKPKTAKDRLILALDVPTVPEAQNIVASTKDHVGIYKIGLQLQFAGGLDFTKKLIAEGHKIFLDVKLLDIDNTIEKAVENIEKIGVTFATIHAYPKTMQAAFRALKFSNLCLLGVTVLTSMDDNDLLSAGYAENVENLVRLRCMEAKKTGIGGIVCSPNEVSSLRKLVGPDLIMVTPGIRPSNAETGDQKRVATPRDAIKAGSDYLVVGRPITASTNMNDTASKLIDEIEMALQ